jgi:hypothetical protein
VALPNEHPVIREKAEKIRVAEAATTAERAELLQLVRRELAAGRATKSSLARALGVSRQRVQTMLED